MARKVTPPKAKRAAAVEAPKAKEPAPRAAARPAAKKKPAPVAVPAAKGGPIALRNVGKRPPAASKNSDAMYIYIEGEQLHIATTAPRSAAHVLSAATFDEAKEKAVDYLIELIDTLERRLWDIKQASDLAGLTSHDEFLEGVGMCRAARAIFTACDCSCRASIPVRQASSSASE